MCLDFSIVILKDTFTQKEIIGSLIVIVGVILGSLPKLTCILPSVNSKCNADGTWKPLSKNNSNSYELESNPSIMVCLFIVSVLFQAIEQVWQDKAFRKPIN